VVKNNKDNKPIFNLDEFNSFVAISPDAILIVDSELKVVVVNEKAIALYGCKTAKSMIGKNALDFVAEVDKQRLVDNIKKTQEKKILKNIEYTLRKENGDFFIGEVSASTSFDKDGQLQAFIVAVRDTTERNSMEIALKESEEKYRALVEQANDGICIVQGMALKYTNPRLAQMLGYSEKEVTSKLFKDYVLSSEVPKVVLHYKRQMTGEESAQSYQTIFVTKKGKEVNVEINTVFINYEGRRAGLLFVRDITERNKSQEKIKESEARYRNLFESANEGILFSDPKTKKFSYMNPAICKMFGYSEDEFKKLKISDIHPKPELKHVLSEFESQAKGEKPVAFNIPCLTKNGSIIYADTSATKIILDEKEYLVGFFTNVTEHKKTIDVLVQSEEKYRCIAENTNNVIMLTKPDGSIDYLSPASKEVFGYEPQELLGKHRSIEHPEDRDKVNKVFSKALGGSSGSGFEYRVVNKDKKTRWVSHSWAPVLKNGGLSFVVSVIRDITERKKIQEQIEIFRKFADLAGQGFGFANLDGKIFYANSTLCSLLEQTPEDVLQTFVFDYYAQEPLERLKKEALPAVLKKGQWIGEINLLSRNKNERTTIQNIFIIRNEKNEPLFYANVLTDITERKEAELLLKASEEKYRLLIDNYGAPITVFDKNGILLLANNAVGEIGGVEAQEYIGKSIYDFFPDKAQELKQRVCDVIESGEGKSFEDVIKLASGEKYFLSSLQPVRNKDGDVYAVQAISQDLTKNKRAEEAVRKGKRLFERALYNMRDAVFIFDASIEKVMDCNPAASKRFGLSRHEFLSCGAASLYSNDAEFDKFKKTLFSIVKDSGFLLDCDFKVKRKNGEIFTSSHNAMPLEDEKGHNVGWICMMSEVLR